MRSRLAYKSMYCLKQVDYRLNLKSTLWTQRKQSLCTRAWRLDYLDQKRRARFESHLNDQIGIDEAQVYNGKTTKLGQFLHCKPQAMYNTSGHAPHLKIICCAGVLQMLPV